MKRKDNFPQLIALLGLVLLGTFATIGCGSDEIQKDSPEVAAKRMTAAKGLRSYFDKAQGNFDALSPEDKAAVIAICKSEANARTAFGHMVLGAPGAGDTSRADHAGGR